MNKFFKRFSSILVFIVMLLISNTIYAQEIIIKNTDDISFLRELEIIPESITLTSDAVLTRGQMVQIILCTVGFSEISNDTVSIYSDINSDNPYLKYINSASEMGIVSGYSNNTFEPNEKATFNQAIKILINIVGYEYHAIAGGGYPNGYLLKASNLGITKGIESTEDKAITFGILAKLIRNSLEVDIANLVSYGTSKRSYSSEKGVNILSQYFDIYKYDGIVSGNYYTVFEPNISLMRNQIILNNIKFNTGITRTADYLGKRVEIYAKETKNDEKIILSMKQSNQCQSVVINAEDITTNTTKEKITYLNDKDKELAITLKTDSLLVLNGAVKKDWMPADITNQMGKITVINPAGSGNEIIIAELYQNCIVSTVNKSEMCVRFMDNKESLVIDGENGDIKTLFINQDGSEAYADECIEWDILSVIQSEDKKVLKVIKSENIVTGTILEINDKTLKIDNKEYEIAASLKNSTTLIKPQINMSGDFFLDFTGKIAAIDTSSFREYKYGYAVLLGIDNGIEKAPKFKIFSEDGTMQILNVAQKVIFNGTIRGNDKILEKENNPFYVDSEFLEQAVTFKINSKNEITEINTALDGTTLSKDEKKDKFTLDYTSASEKFLGFDSMMFATRYIPRSETKIFVIPNKYDNNDKKYSIISYSSLHHYSEGEYINPKFYDITDDNVISMLVLPDAAADNIAQTTTTAVVKKHSQGINENDEIVDLVTLYNSRGEEVRVYGTEDFLVSAGGKTITDLRTESEVEIFDLSDDQDNLLKNGGFEIANNGIPYGWTNWKGTMSCDSDIRLTGEKSLKMLSSENMLVSQKLKLVGGGNYTLTTNINSQEPKAGNTLAGAVKLQFSQNDGKYIGSYDVSDNYKNLVHGTWENHSLTFSVPENAPNVEVLLRLNGSGVVYWDDVTLKRNLQSNLITNGDFENVNTKGEPLNWGAWPTIPLTTSTSVIHGGNNALKMQHTGNLLATQKFSVTAGKEYEITSFINPESGNNAYGAVKLQFSTPSGYNSQLDIQKKYESVPRDQWTQNTFKFTVPDGVVSVELLLRLLGAGSIYWDDVVMTPMEKHTEDEKPETNDVKVFKEQISLTALAPGDIVQYEALATGELKAMKVLFRSNVAKAETVIPIEKSGGSTSASWDYNDLLYSYSTVNDRTKYGIRVYVPYGDNPDNPLVERLYLFNKAKIILFENSKFNIVNSGEISKDDRVVSIKQSTTQRFIIIYR